MNSVQGKRGVWIKIPIELVSLVEPAVKVCYYSGLLRNCSLVWTLVDNSNVAASYVLQEGFYFHHAEPKYLMLVHWLPSTPNTLPANASHRVGIGAFVMNEKNEVRSCV